MTYYIEYQIDKNQCVRAFVKLRYMLMICFNEFALQNKKNRVYASRFISLYCLLWWKILSALHLFSEISVNYVLCSYRRLLKSSRLDEHDTTYELTTLLQFLFADQINRCQCELRVFIVSCVLYSPAIYIPLISNFHFMYLQYMCA